MSRLLGLAAGLAVAAFGAGFLIIGLVGAALGLRPIPFLR